jgi:hypothetical protein
MFGCHPSELEYVKDTLEEPDFTTRWVGQDGKGMGLRLQYMRSFEPYVWLDVVYDEPEEEEDEDVSDPAPDVRRIVQIACAGYGECVALYALGNDGSAWIMHGGSWDRLPSLPTDAPVEAEQEDENESAAETLDTP